MTERKYRVSLADKNANNRKWYEDTANYIDSVLSHNNFSATSNNGYKSVVKRMKTNYDLFNNILNEEDLKHVLKPLGDEYASFPAKMKNRDIISGKIRYLLGVEKKRNTSYNVIAVNPEATTRKEQTQFAKIQEWLDAEIMKPIEQQIRMKAEAQSQNKELTEDEKASIEQQIQQELETMTPPEVLLYMQRKHQDPAEAMAQQLLEYLSKKLNLHKLFLDCMKHGLISGRSICRIDIFNGEPSVKVVNPINFRFKKTANTDYIQDADSCCYTEYMTPIQISKMFGDELTEEQLDDIFSCLNNYTTEEEMIKDWFYNSQEMEFSDYEVGTIPVKHIVWKDLRKIGFLSYLDDEGEVQELVVDENYILDEEAGDLSLSWSYIPEVYETWKIKNDIFLRKRPIPGQQKDIDNIYEAKLPYVGVIYDDTNSQETSIVDRLKDFQYLYNIIWYRLEMLINTDKGKKVMMNINAIPNDANIDVKKWQYYMEKSPVMWYSSNGEGATYQDANTVAKVIDLSLVSDINKYIEIAEVIKTQAGESIGILKQTEGQIGASEEVGNTRQSLVQTSYLLEPYFQLHADFKKCVLSQLLETAKIAYSNSGKKKLTYFLDDMSQKMLDLDSDILDNNTYGLFLSDSTETEDIKETAKQLAHAGVQAGTFKISDVISLMRQNNIVEMMDYIKRSEENSQKQAQAVQEAQQKAQAESEEKAREFEREKVELEMKRDTNKEIERRKTVELQMALTGASFNPDVDNDGDGENDFIEIAKHGVQADVAKSKIEVDQDKRLLDREKFNHTREMDLKNLELNKEKLRIEEKKINKKQ